MGRMSCTHNMVVWRVREPYVASLRGIEPVIALSAVVQSYQRTTTEKDQRGSIERAEGEQGGSMRE